MGSPKSFKKSPRYHALYAMERIAPPLPLDGWLLGTPLFPMERLKNRTGRQRLLRSELLNLYFRVVQW